ncbi:MAG: hypothetical protein AB8H03_24520 [Saprospiraceae bacterium]
MKKILGQYPSVFYQILLLFVLSEIVFSFCTFDLVPLYELLNISDPNNYKPLTIITLYIISGILVDTIRDFQKGILLATILYVIGFLFTSFGFESNQLLFLIGGIFCTLAHCIFVILCIFHVGLLFPVANDWKDIGFLFLLIPYFLFEILPKFDSDLISHSGDPITGNDPLFILLFFLIISLIFYLLTQFKNLGFKIEIIEEEDTEEELMEENFIRKSMIGCVLVALVFSFITMNLPGLKNFQPPVDSFIYFRDKLAIVIFFTFLLSIYIFWFAYFKTLSYQSRHSKKMITITILLIIIGGLEYVITTRYISLFDLTCLLIFYLIIIPMILSIMTHINLDRNIGFWLGTFFAMPFVVDQLITFFYLGRILPEVLPYTSVFLLIVFLIIFKIKQKSIEKELALNEPNRQEEEEEDIEGVDILDHFIDQ